MKRHIIYGLYLFFILDSCNSNTGNDTAIDEQQDSLASDRWVSLSEQQIKSAGLTIGHPIQQAVSGVLKLQGSIDVPPNSTISLSFPLGGYLKSTGMLPGMQVKKGQVLGVMEDMQFIQLQQDYLTSRERFQLAELEFNRQKDLNLSKASSDKVFEQARVELETQRINMNALGQKLALIGLDPKRLTADNISKSVRITSPINGFISKVNVNVGKYTAPTDMLFELVDPSDIHLALDVFEKDLPAIAIGQKVMAYTNSDPSEMHEAEIILISKNLNQDRTAEVHCHFENYEPNLYPGMFMNGDVEVNSKTALTVPEDAVVRWENNYYVFAEKSKEVFEMIPITLGILSKGLQEIEGENIDTTTRLVLRNAHALLMKAKNSAEED